MRHRPLHVAEQNDAVVRPLQNKLGRVAGIPIRMHVTLLILLTALKFMELRSARDAMVLVYLACFIIITNFFYSQAIATAVYLLGVTVLLVARERKWKKLLYWDSALFIGGAAFSHYVVFPAAWAFFASFSNSYIEFTPRIEALRTAFQQRFNLEAPPVSALSDKSVDGAAKVLTDLGFDVVVDEEALAAEKPKRVKPAKPKPAAARDVKPKVCPSCHMALPASGVCDFCD